MTAKSSKKSPQRSSWKKDNRLNCHCYWVRPRDHGTEESTHGFICQVCKGLNGADAHGLQVTAPSKRYGVDHQEQSKCGGSSCIVEPSSRHSCAAGLSKTSTYWSAMARTTFSSSQRTLLTCWSFSRSSKTRPPVATCPIQPVEATRLAQRLSQIQSRHASRPRSVAINRHRHRVHATHARAKTTGVGWKTANTQLRQRKRLLKTKTPQPRPVVIRLGQKRVMSLKSVMPHRNMVGRFHKDMKDDKENTKDNSPLCITTVSNFKDSIDATGRCNVGADDSIPSTALTKRAVFKGVGKIEAIYIGYL